MRFAASLLCAVASAALFVPSASAQSVDRIVAFGDSYADDGNLFQLLGIAPPAAYPNGRFSNGTNFVDTMGLLLGVPIDNFAIGGAFTGNGNINGPGIPGFTTEWQSFLAGGGPAAFPRVSGAFAPTDLLVISIGGNDARAYRLTGGTVANASAAAAPKVAEATAGLNALVNAGAGNITFLAGDVGRLPEAVGQPSAAAGSAFSGAFNSGMQTTLAGYANQGVIVNYLDLNLIGDRVQADPAAFGLTSAGASTAADVQAGRADQFLFYADNVHLSSAGFAIVGQYAVRQLEAPLHFQAQSDVGLETARAFGATLENRLDLSNARSGRDGNGLSVYVTGSVAGTDRHATLTNLGYDLDIPAVTGGVEYDAASLTVGAAGRYARPKADMTDGSGDARAEAIQVGLYGAFGSGTGFFGQAHAGYGWLDYENARAAVIDDLSGESEGEAITAGAKVGVLFGLGGWRVGPVVGVQYARAEIDGYTETGDAVLTLNVEDQEVQALVGSAGIETRGEMDWSGLSIAPFAALTAEKDFEGDGRIIRYAGTAAPGIVNSFVLPERSKDVYGRFTAGASFELASRLALEVSGNASFEREDGDDFSGLIGVKLGF